MTPPSPRSNPEARLLAGLSALSLDTALATQLLAYVAELQKWNKAYNLTAVRDPAEMVTRHILDSLAVLEWGQTCFSRAENRSVPISLVDVGSGAGLPGIPIAIARPDVNVTLLDSNGKKARFLRHVQRTLKLENVSVVEERAERHEPEKPYSVVISRAFGSLRQFLESTARLGASDGQWLAMKGKLGAAELNDLPPGFHIMHTHPLRVPGLAEERHVVVVTRS